MNRKIKESLRKGRSIMVQSEWQHLFKNKILLLSVAVIMFIPIMYGGFFLGSIWDPYGKTGDLPVAFVNQDEGAMLHGQALNIGNDVTQTLKNNDDIGWDFVTKKVAEDGVSSGHYYAVVTIPEDFSRNTASITSTHPQQATMTYTLTPAKNYIGSLVSTQAADKVKSRVSEQIVKAYTKGIFDNINVLSTGLTQASDGATQLANGTAQLSSGVYQYTNAVSKIATNQQSLYNGLAQLQSGAMQLQGGIKQTESALPTNDQITQLINGVTQIQAGISALNNGVNNPSQEIIHQQEEVDAYAHSLKDSLEKLSGNTEETSDILTQAVQEASQSQDDKTTLRLVQVRTLVAFANNAEEVSVNSVSLLTSLDKLTTMLDVQQKSLGQNVESLNTGMSTLAPGVIAALNGYDALRAANNQLLNGSTALTNGLSTARDGSRQLAQGASTLNVSSSTLKNGISQISDGSATLANRLAEAASQVKLQPTGEATQSQFASPVKSEETRKGDVPNYGYALAPYVLSLGLFVGALVFNVIYPIRKTFSEQENAFRWWLAKASVAGAAAFIQATILMLIMVLVLGLHPDYPLQFSLAIYLTSFVYMSIVSLLVIMFDNVGRFLAMVILVLQLGGSEGTFPIQTAPAFFQAINPFLPMTYSIHSLRESISGGLSTQYYLTSMWSLLAVLIVANLLLIIFFAYRGHRTFAHTSVDGDN